VDDHAGPSPSSAFRPLGGGRRLYAVCVMPAAPPDAGARPVRWNQPGSRLERESSRSSATDLLRKVQGDRGGRRMRRSPTWVTWSAHRSERAIVLRFDLRAWRASSWKAPGLDRLRRLSYSRRQVGPTHQEDALGQALTFAESASELHRTGFDPFTDEGRRDDQKRMYPGRNCVGAPRCC